MLHLSVKSQEAIDSPWIICYNTLEEIIVFRR